MSIIIMVEKFKDFYKKINEGKLSKYTNLTPQQEEKYNIALAPYIKKQNKITLELDKIFIEISNSSIQDILEKDIEYYKDIINTIEGLENNAMSNSDMVSNWLNEMSDEEYSKQWVNIDLVNEGIYSEIRDKYNTLYLLLDSLYSIQNIDIKPFDDNSANITITESE